MATRNIINNALDGSVTMTVANGGTAAVTLTDHGVLIGRGTSAVEAISVGGNGTLLIGVTGAAPTFGTSTDSDFTFTSATSGVTRVLTVSNTDNTAAATSAARVDITTGGANVGDPRIYTLATLGFSCGIDNSDSDKYKISKGTALGTTDALVAYTTGEINLPLLSAFCYQTGTGSNVTGDGTLYTVVYGSTPLFDQNSDFAYNTGTFTASKTGRYQLNFYLAVDGASCTSDMTTSTTVLYTSNRSYTVGYVNVYTAYCGQYFSLLVDMDAADTAKAQIKISGGSKVVDFYGVNFISGYLGC